MNMDERICARCPRKDTCPGTANQTCLRMAVELFAEMADKCARLQTLFDEAMIDLTGDNPEGRCNYCRYKDDGAPHCKADCGACEKGCRCQTCDAGSNWAWRVEM